MPIRHVHYSSDFRTAYRNLPAKLQNLVDKKDAFFRTDLYHPSLRTHKLHGPLADLWAFSINRSYRVLFEFVKDGALFLDIGTHDIYK